MIDLHSHILYDIDDGSRSLEMSLIMLRMAVRSGTTHLFATPHVNRRGVIPQWQTIVDKVEALQQAARELSIPIELHAGAEVELNYDTLRFIKQGSRDYCLAGSRYILVELTSQSQPDQVENLLFELMLRDFIPVLAHPERYDRIMGHPDRVLKWMQRGVLTQCNAGSFTGSFGKETKKRAEQLLQHHMICFLGSDAHRNEHRNPDLREAEEQLEAITGGTRLWEQCERNAMKVLQDKIFYPDVPEHWHPVKKSFFARLFGRK